MENEQHAISRVENTFVAGMQLMISILLLVPSALSHVCSEEILLKIVLDIEYLIHNWFGKEWNSKATFPKSS